MPKVIIIGAGPAGISTSLYTLRGNIETTIFTHNESALMKAEKIENYYGFPNGIGGEELYKRGIEQAKALGAEIRDEEVTGALWDGGFIVSTNRGEYAADVLVIATGASRKVPKIENIKKFEGRGVSYCAVCDAFFYRNKNVCVIGSGDYALHEAEILKRTAKRVTVLTDGETALDYDDCITDKIRSVEGGDTVETIVFENGSEIQVSGVFIAIGTAGAADIARKLGAVTDGKYISVNENMAASVPGLYAPGDSRGGLLQVAKAVSDGAATGMDIIRSLKDLTKK